MAKAVATRKRKAQTGSSGDVRPSGISGFAEGALPFAAGFFDADGAIAVDRVADAFSLTKFQLADILGLSRETLYKQSRAHAPKTQARMREMLEIIGLVEDWAGGKLQALAWYRAQSIPAFGGRTAESLVKSGYASAVRDYIDHMAMGGFA